MNYWPLFEKFCRAEMETGGPDPQIPTILRIVRNSSRSGDVDCIWIGGCYGAHHCVSSAFAVWENWTAIEVVKNQNNFLEWLENYWDYLPVRPEMRSHRMLEKRHKCLVDFAHYALSQSWKYISDFDILWKDCIDNVKYFGRYMAIKFIEIGHQGNIFKPKMPDMRAQGAWSPRRTLGLLYPDIFSLSDRNDTSEAGYLMMETCAADALQYLSRLGINVNYFKLQVMLCEFREALEGTYYPGASLDEELGLISKTSKRFDVEEIFKVRKELFLHKYLGEIGGWSDIRPEKYKEFK